MTIKERVVAIRDRIKAEYLNAIAMFATLGGSIISHIDAFATVIGDPNLNQQIAGVVSDAKWLGRWMLTVGIVTSIARIKSLISAPPPKAP